MRMIGKLIMPESTTVTSSSTAAYTMTSAPAVFIPEYPDEERVWGVDVSIWDDDNETPQGIDYNKMKEEGASFVYIRAGQGRLVDEDFVVNWAAAKEAGLLRGAYWFLDARYSANSQGLLFRSLLAQDPGELRPCVDYEHETTSLDKTKGKTRSRKLFLNIGMLDGFLSTFDWPAKPLIYTGYYYWLDHGSKDARWSEYPLWLAQYKVQKPQVPPPWKDWLFWQFTETGPGKVLGLESNAADLDYFNGTKEQLAKFAGTAPAPEPPSAEPTLKGKQTLTVTWEDGNGPHVLEKEIEF